MFKKQTFYSTNSEEETRELARFLDEEYATYNVRVFVDGTAVFFDIS